MTVDEKGLDVVAALAHLREKVRDLGDSVVKGGSYIGACGDVIDLIDAKIAYLSARSAEPNMWGVRVPTSRQEATAMQIVAERWLAENSGPAARSVEPVAEFMGIKVLVNPQLPPDAAYIESRRADGSVDRARVDLAHPTPEASQWPQEDLEQWRAEASPELQINKIGRSDV